MPRLLQEARCLARVRHPNVVAIHDCLPELSWRIVDPDAVVGACPVGKTAMIVMQLPGRAETDASVA